jgi:mono/diheme cytochrome c family protein
MATRILTRLALLAAVAPLLGFVQKETQSPAPPPPQNVPQGQTQPRLAMQAMPQAAPRDPVLGPANPRDDAKAVHAEFRTSDRCVACHNGLKTSAGEDVSIGLQWQASLMANAGRDPYWQASIRRETLDHPEVKSDIEDECSTCHMPVQHFANRDAGRQTAVFVHLPLQLIGKGNYAAADGVTCSVCHQAEPAGFGTQESFNGNLTFARPIKNLLRPEYGPYNIDAGHQSAMMSSTGGYDPMQGDHMRDAGLCGTCHTLYTKARGANGKVVGVLPEQMPFLEWQHSDYAEPGTDNVAGAPVAASGPIASSRAPGQKPRPQTCQECHMPEVTSATAVTALYGQPRDGMHRHVFVGGNFLMSAMLENHREDLAVEAQPEELHAQVQRTIEFLQTQSARVEIGAVTPTARGIAFDVHAQNLTGHKLPTAYPSRRVWLHVTVRDGAGKVVFESGHLNADGSIVGNANDADPRRYEPHFTEITQPDQVEIYEPILKSADGKVTTGLLDAVGYFKDNRLLPSGFDKATAVPDVRVVGAAAEDPKFDDQGSTVRYSVATGGAAGPFRVDVELVYQPIGYRWAHNFEPYDAAEPKRLVSYYEQAAHDSAVVLAHAETTR